MQVMCASIQFGKLLCSDVRGWRCTTMDYSNIIVKYSQVI